jgi:hypothetical protein
MASRYYVQFNAGLGEFAVGALHRDLPAARVVFRDDSAAIIESAAEPSQVATLPYLTGSLLFLAGARRGPLAAVVPALARQLDRADTAGRTPRRRPFRVVTSVDGALVALPPRARARLESAVAAGTGGWVQGRGSGEEYWVVGRRGLPDLLLGLRLAGRRARTPAPGTLGPELADLLVRASGPRPGDVFLDPSAAAARSSGPGCGIRPAGLSIPIPAIASCAASSAPSWPGPGRRNSFPRTRGRCRPSPTPRWTSLSPIRPGANSAAPAPASWPTTPNSPPGWPPAWAGCCGGPRGALSS